MCERNRYRKLYPNFYRNMKIEVNLFNEAHFTYPKHLYYIYMR